MWMSGCYMFHLMGLLMFKVLHEILNETLKQYYLPQAGLEPVTLCILGRCQDDVDDCVSR